MTQSAAVEENNENLLSQSAFLYAATHLSVFIKFLGGFITAGILGPTLFGLRTGFGLVMEYERFSHAGTFNAMGREVPYHRAQNQGEKAEEIVSNVLGVNLLYAVLAGATSILVAVYLFLTGHDRVYVDFVCFFAVWLFFSKVRIFYEVKLVVDKKSSVLSISRVLYQLAGALFGVTFVFLYGLQGWFIGLLVAEVITAGFLRYYTGKIPRLRLSKTLIGQLIKIGLPIMLIALAFLLLTSVDRIIVVAMLSSEMLGYFGIATIISGVISVTLADVIRVVVFPRMMERLGASGDISKLKNYLVEPTLLVSYFIPVVIGAGFLSVHLPLLYFIPSYSPAISVSKILILGSFFFCVLTSSLQVCIAMNKQVKMLCLTLGAVALNGVFSYALIELGLGINGVAAGTAVAYFIFSVVIIAYALKQFEAPAAEYVRFFAMVYTPFIYATALLFILDAAVLVAVDGMWTDVLASAVKIVVFVAAFVLILFPMRRQRVFIRVANGLPIFHRRVQAYVR